MLTALPRAGSLLIRLYFILSSRPFCGPIRSSFDYATLLNVLYDVSAFYYSGLAAPLKGERLIEIRPA
jgi:hypothetical protein